MDGRKIFRSFLLYESATSPMQEPQPFLPAEGMAIVGCTLSHSSPQLQDAAGPKVSRDTSWVLLSRAGN